MQGIFSFSRSDHADEADGDHVMEETQQGSNPLRLETMIKRPNKASLSFKSSKKDKKKA